MGLSEFSGFLVDLALFTSRCDNLYLLEAPFSSNEIDGVIKNLPNNKSPGPDGFNNEFYKKCWPLIKVDFYNMCKAFHGNRLCLRSIISSHITLVPKVEDPTSISDYRPISLLNSSFKLLTKCLSLPRWSIKTSMGSSNPE